MDESCKESTRQRVSRLARFSNITNTQSYNTNGNREKREINWKVYSPPCAAITSCSTRGVCSPVDCIHRLEYASWGQATICQIKPIAHVRRAVSSVLFSCVYVANVSCMHYATSPPIASRCVALLHCAPEFS